MRAERCDDVDHIGYGRRSALSRFWERAASEAQRVGDVRACGKS